MVYRKATCVLPVGKVSITYRMSRHMKKGTVSETLILTWLKIF